MPCLRYLRRDASQLVSIGGSSAFSLYCPYSRRPVDARQFRASLRHRWRFACSGARARASGTAVGRPHHRAKSKRTLELLHDGAVFESFPIALGREPRGPKQEEGDGRTPEGVYRIDWRSTQTRYTRALHISYPDENERDRAQAMKVDPGGAIFIHGLPTDYGPFDPPRWYRDWTEGCISVGNAAVVKIWETVPDGTPIEILP